MSGYLDDHLFMPGGREQEAICRLGEIAREAQEGKRD